MGSWRVRSQRSSRGASKESLEFKAVADAIHPTISMELCIERGKCFTACNCGRLCMRALAMQDGELFDDLLQQMREAHARSQADADAPRAQRAKQILHGSAWRHDMVGVVSPLLAALIAEERRPRRPRRVRKLAPLRPSLSR